MEQKDYKYISVAYKLYDITDNKQELIEETAKDKPFVFLSGFGTTLEDFESNLVGLAEGDDFDFVLSPDRAYGEHVDTRVVELDKQIFSVDGKFDSKNIPRSHRPAAERGRQPFPRTRGKHRQRQGAHRPQPPTGWYDAQLQGYHPRVASCHQCRDRADGTHAER